MLSHPLAVQKQQYVFSLALVAVEVTIIVPPTSSDGTRALASSTVSGPRLPITHNCTHTHTHTQTHTRTHAHTHARTHAHKCMNRKPKHTKTHIMHSNHFLFAEFNYSHGHSGHLERQLVAWQSKRGRVGVPHRTRAHQLPTSQLFHMSVDSAFHVILNNTL